MLYMDGKQKVGAVIRGVLFSATVLSGAIFLCANTSAARDIEYEKGEIDVRVNPGEPTQIEFPGAISGGFRKKVSSLSLDHKDNDLVIFAGDSISENGEAIIVRLQDGRSYSLRIARSTPAAPRDDMLTIRDQRPAFISEETDPAYREKSFEYAPPTQVSGLMRELVLASEFGKSSIPGYRASDSYKGQLVLDDGTVRATVTRIYMGTNLWAYEIDAENLLGQTQKINPAAFRIDGTRAISAKYWELAPIPLTIEQQISAKHKTKVYIITRARKQ